MCSETESSLFTHELRGHVQCCDGGGVGGEGSVRYDDHKCYCVIKVGRRGRTGREVICHQDVTPLSCCSLKPCCRRLCFLSVALNDVGGVLVEWSSNCLAARRLWFKVTDDSLYLYHSVGAADPGAAGGGREGPAAVFWRRHNVNNSRLLCVADWPASLCPHWAPHCYSCSLFTAQA